MNIAETEQQIRVALEQAAISERKRQHWLQLQKPYTALVYGVRKQALIGYADSLKMKIAAYRRKQFKKNNSENGKGYLQQ